MEYRSRRSTVYGRRGMVASSQPLASAAGVEVLHQGGNAADAAIAIAASLAVTEPCSTGIGGDAFVLYYDAGSGKVTAILGNGRAPKRAVAPDVVDPYGAEAVTVPGAAAAWVDIVETFGEKELSEVLAPAISLAEGGFPVAPLTAKHWGNSVEMLKAAEAATFLVDNERTPKAGEVFKNPDLAQVMRELAAGGKEAFYSGRVAQAIVDTLKAKNGYMELDDLASQKSIFTEPISASYRGLEVYEVPPPTHGVAALMAFNIAENFEIGSKAGYEQFSGAHLHTMIECMSLAFCDCKAFVADPDHTDIPLQQLLSKEYGSERSKIITDNALKCDKEVDLSAFAKSETVQFCVVDGKGNACSMVNSNFLGFGTGMVPEGCGFSLHNRGLNFSCDPEHPNCYKAGKRPYHTIIPAMALKDGKLFSAFGVMGGFMQPQGHFQVLSNIIDWGMDPQSAIDAPRFLLGDPATGKGFQVNVEDGINEDAREYLRQHGHEVIGPFAGDNRQMFGRGQIILHDSESGVLAGGSDPRADGLAIPF